MELSREQHQIIVEARMAMRRVIMDAIPDDIDLARRLLTVAMVGDFTDFISRSMGRPDILAQMNEQLADVGLEIAERPRN